MPLLCRYFRRHHIDTLYARYAAADVIDSAADADISLILRLRCRYHAFRFFAPLMPPHIIAPPLILLVATTRRCCHYYCLRRYLIYRRPARYYMPFRFR